jgi:hypothetical protein
MFSLSAILEEGPHFAEKPVTIVTRAKYRTGENFTDGKVTWEATAEVIPYRPPGTTTGPATKKKTF